MADVSKALNIVRKLSPSGFFSRAAEEAQKLPQAKGTPEQMRAMLLKQGVKPDELKWTGFDEWAKGKKSVTRDEVAKFLDENRVNVGEKVLGDASVRRFDELSDAFNAARRAGDADAMRRIRSEMEAAPRAEPKFDQYTLPGGENYREVLLTGDGRARAERALREKYADDLSNIETQIKATNDELQPLWGKPGKTDEEDKRIYELRDRLSDLGRQRGAINATIKRELGSGVDYQSPHWDEPDALLHMRMKDRTDAEGRRILHLEELQSDWAQEGRKKGFKQSDPQAEYDAYLNDLRARAKAAAAEDARGTPGISEDFLQRHLAKIDGMSSDQHALMLGERDRLKEEYAKFIEAQRALPSAPFVENTPGWTNLALKRAMIEAARGNYDAIAWTPGAEQAKRYDLSKQIDAINYGMSKDGKTVSLEAVKDGQNIFNRPNMPIEELEGLVGKEVAEKIVKGVGETDPNSGYRVLSGLDLQVGGEGMKGYYDKILPTQVQKVLKDINETPQFGEVKISNPARPVDPNSDTSALYRELSGEDLKEVGGQSYKLPSFNLTPEMREKIKEGLPLFTMMPAAVGLGASQMQEGQSPAAEGEGFAKGGHVEHALRLIQDQYPTHYLPNVGRQVMADGGETAQSRRRATLEELGAFEDTPPMDPATMGQNWASAVERFRRTPLREGETFARSFTPSVRDEIGQAIAGNDRFSQAGEIRGRTADLLVGSRGTPGSGTLGFGLLDAPMVTGIPLQATDVADAASKGDYLGAALGTALPAAFYARKPIMAAGRAAYDAGKRAVDVAGDVLGRVPAPVAAGAAGAAVMTPEDAEAAKSKMVQQVLQLVRTADRPASSQFVSQAGEHGYFVPQRAKDRDPRKWHPLSTTVLSRPLGEMHAERAVSGNPMPRKYIRPEDLEGGSLVAGLGDRTVGDSRLLAVNEMRLRNPVEMQAGHSFMYGPASSGPDRAIWASDPGVVTILANKAKAEAEAGYQPYLSYVAMGSRSGDYSHHMTDTLREMLKNSKVSRDTIAEFDRQMRENTANKWAPYADWPGLKSKNLEEYLYGKGPGKARTKMAELMGQGQFQKLGMPDVGAARFAITDPALLHAQDYSAGHSIAKLDPSGRIIKNPAIPHKTYRTQLGAASDKGYVGGFEYDIPFEVMNKEYIDKLMARDAEKYSNPSQLAYTYRMDQPVVRMTPQVVDRLSTFIETKRRGLIP